MCDDAVLVAKNEMKRKNFVACFGDGLRFLLVLVKPSRPHTHTETG